MLERRKNKTTNKLQSVHSENDEILGTKNVQQRNSKDTCRLKFYRRVREGWYYFKIGLNDGYVDVRERGIDNSKTNEAN